MDVYTDFRQFNFVTGYVLMASFLGSSFILFLSNICKTNLSDLDDDFKEVEKAGANHPLVKQTIMELQKQESYIGYLQYHEGPLIKLANLTMYKNVLYCEHNGSVVSVSSVLSNEKNLTRPRWLNYVYVEEKTESSRMLLKDYIAQKHNLVFS